MKYSPEVPECLSAYLDERRGQYVADTIHAAVIEPAEDEAPDNPLHICVAAVVVIAVAYLVMWALVALLVWLKGTGR